MRYPNRFSCDWGRLSDITVFLRIGFGAGAQVGAGRTGSLDSNADNTHSARAITDDGMPAMRAT